jgi:hypothetical protein
MKIKLPLALATLGVLLGCSHYASDKRIPASAKDNGAVREYGEVLLYSKSGDYIFYKICAPDTLLGNASAGAMENCPGKTNKIPVESFKQTVRNMVSTSRLNLLKTLTPEEVKNFKKEKLSTGQIDAILAELTEINDFFASYSVKNSSLVKRSEVLKSLGSVRGFERVIKKIDAEIERTMQLMVDQTQHSVTRSKSDKKKFLYKVLEGFNQKSPCGLEGTLDERIQDCSSQINSEKEGFVLVARTTDFKEVHKEVSTGLLWSDRLPEVMNHFSAENVCQLSNPEFAGISGVNWRLPSLDEYKEADRNGIRKALPNMNYWFWTSTIRRDYAVVAELFYGVNGNSVGFYRRLRHDSVRCVASLP